jgi:hypothetical protein
MRKPLRAWAETALALTNAQALYDLPYGAAAMQALLSGVCYRKARHAHACLHSCECGGWPSFTTVGEGGAATTTSSGKEGPAATTTTTDGEVEGCRFR